MNLQEIKICEQCIHYAPRFERRYTISTHMQKCTCYNECHREVLDFVTGEVNMGRHQCQEERTSTDPWMCGYEGRFFRYKPEALITNKETK